MRSCIFVVVVTVLFIAVELSGCMENTTFTSDSRLVGAWKYTEAYKKVILFFPDGTWTSGSAEGTWNIEEEELVVRRDGSVISTYDYEFSDNDTKLRLTNVDSGETFIYVKP